MKYLWWMSALLLLVLALPRSGYGENSVITQDPCSVGLKKSAGWDISAMGFQEIIPGVANKQIYICNLVFTGSASSGLQMVFDAGVPNSSCNSVVAGFGGLTFNNTGVMSAGGGSSTQFTVPMGDSLCIQFLGVSPIASSGWVAYVQR